MKEILQSLKSSWGAVVYILILSVFLFFFFPRIPSLIKSKNATQRGEIGYSSQINNSSASELFISDKTAFYAFMPKINQRNLYWKGRVLNTTDGYNWRYTEYLQRRKKQNQKKTDLKIFMKYEDSFDEDLILLDETSGVMESQKSFYKNSVDGTFHFYSEVPKTTLWSFTNLEKSSSVLLPKERTVFLQLPQFIPKKLKELVGKNLDGGKVVEKFRKYVLHEKFGYTLQPGKMPTMSDFLKKKSGFCTHYASFLAIILRLHQVPARVVVGFQGGTYNRTGSFYKVRSKDSHAWVEYFSDKWIRVDPTAFIDPRRIEWPLSLTNNGTVSVRTQPSELLKLFNKTRMYLNSINVNFSLFIEGFDSRYQHKILKSLNMRKKHFHIILISFLILLLFVAFWLLNRKRRLSELEIIFKKFTLKLKKRGINIHISDDMNNLFEKTKNVPASKEFLEAYSLYAYSQNTKSIKNLKRLLKDI